MHMESECIFRFDNFIINYKSLIEILPYMQHFIGNLMQITDLKNHKQ